MLLIPSTSVGHRNNGIFPRMILVFRLSRNSADGHISNLENLWFHGRRSWSRYPFSTLSTTMSHSFFRNIHFFLLSWEVRIPFSQSTLLLYLAFLSLGVWGYRQNSFTSTWRLLTEVQPLTLLNVLDTINKVRGSLSHTYYIFNNYSSSPRGLWVNSPWDRRPNGLLTQRPWGREE